MTMPRPSLVTSSGPSPVRGFIAAILPSPSSGLPPHSPAGHNPSRPCTRHYPVPTVEPASHNRFYLSPYYPVFGSRMVMIGHPGRHECVRNGIFTGRSAIAPACRVEQPAAAGLASSVRASRRAQSARDALSPRSRRAQSF
jgi:hypothetical protein